MISNIRLLNDEQFGYQNYTILIVFNKMGNFFSEKFTSKIVYKINLKKRQIKL